MARGKGTRERRVGSGRERSSGDPFFFLALQRHADVGGRKRTTEKLKWTPAGISSTENGKKRDGISMNERHTASVIIKFAPTVPVWTGKFFVERYLLLPKKSNRTADASTKFYDFCAVAKMRE